MKAGPSELKISASVGILSIKETGKELAGVGPAKLGRSDVDVY